MGLNDLESLVSAVQYAPELFNVQKNLQTAQRMAFEACSKGAEIVVLPELCISGQNIKNVSDAMMCAQTRDGYQTEALSKITSMFSSHVVFGYIELLEGKLYNSACIVGPNGYVGNVQKHNLWGSDNLWAQPSEGQCPIVPTRAGRLGALICRDAMNKYRTSYKFYNPDHKFYRRGDVDVIALLTNWGQSYGYPDNSWVELAEELSTNVIVSNRVGLEEGVEFKGGSCIITRKRKIYTNGSSFTDDAVVGGLIT